MPEFGKSEAIRPQEENNESAERNSRDQLELRLLFAEAVSAKNGESIDEVLLWKTDLYGRLFQRAAHTGEVDPEWAVIGKELKAAQSHDERLKIIERYYKQVDKREHRKDRYWPFRYSYIEKENAIGMHFGNMRLDIADAEGPGLLSSELLDEQKAKLKAMFTEIKEKYGKHPGLVVRGASWLYGRESYRRLYPPAYTEHRIPRKTSEFVGGGTWGQFQTTSGKVNPEVKNAFLANLKDIDLSDLYKVFPNETYKVSAPIEEFYTFYGIE